MSKTICFDRTAEAKRVLKNGISATSAHARSELRTAAWYLINKTTYTAKQIEERLRSVSSDYFKGMPEEYINASIQEIMLSVQYGGTPDGTSDSPPSITIYKEELETIAALGHDDTERLAFVYLCVAKMKPYKHIYECNAELYRLAWKYSYDSAAKKVLGRLEKRRVGGCGPTNRVNRLCQAGIVQYSVRINTSNKARKPTSSAMFTVPIVRNDGEVAFIIDKPDEDSLVLYYDRYKGYSGLITCAHCGKPALRTGRRQKYCSACAEAINNHAEKADLCAKITA